MQLMPSVNLKQKQSLVMTPQLQQAIKLLQMTNLDIQQYLEQQALENPFLEVEADNPDKDDTSQTDAADNNQQIDDTAAEAEQGDDVANLTETMTDGTALADDPTQHGDIENRYDADTLELGSGSMTTAASTMDDDWDNLANTVANTPDSLSQHVLRQIELAIKTPHERFIAYLLADALEPSGWLGRSVDEIASAAGTAAEEVETVLGKLQQLDPAGIFARDLAECLRLQAEDADCLTPLMQGVLNNLEMLGRGDIAGLSRRLDCTASEISEALRQIRCFNPKPGEAYLSTPQPMRSPDIIVKAVEKDGETIWQLDLNRSTLPSITIREDYAEQLQEKAPARTREATRAFTGTAIGSARWLKRALEQRNATTLKISAEIIRQQTAFLHHGLSALKPLALKDVAEAVQMHESTVSRVTSGLMIATPKGSFSLKAFFSVSISTKDKGEGTAAAAVRNLIRTMIANETPGKPLSDDAIAAQISDKGITLARRTVAKYREMMRIPSSSERRRQARLNMAG